MAVEILGLDHLYITVSDLRRSEQFYDPIMERLGFRKGDSAIGGDSHAHYFNPHLQYTIRPSRSAQVHHNPYSPGLHHVCFQVQNRSGVNEAYRELAELGVDATEPREYPEYNDDYYATFFSDPDGIRLEIVARSRTRDEIRASWSLFRVFLNPLADLRARRERGRAGRQPANGRELTVGEVGPVWGCAYNTLYGLYTLKTLYLKEPLFCIEPPLWVSLPPRASRP